MATPDHLRTQHTISCLTILTDFRRMKGSTLSMLLWLLLTTYLHNTQSLSAKMKRAHKHCLFECANCMVLWGKHLYDGKRCAACCHYSNGKVTDPECKKWANKGTMSKRGENSLDNFDIEKYLSRFKGSLPNYCFA